ncbi:molybdenum cofactor sulfurylase [Roseiarcus fermentans]|uniref:Molybdenum cofactor sulfurylase n=1 Tax=Roseiarcus fermentans TaxID=1473586 RepID=A0A366F3H5_9HYPH|nr:xanthine dehydrogenase accessory protein XdhC [Roseiarcus fermentans]RBP09147.1 molybdenum cofactor sulfurylase [Roseiarcus fermentans]
MLAFRRLLDAIEAEGSAALVTLARVRGSSPREAGARMVVRPSGGFHGTIGGGALEWVALEAARAALTAGRAAALRRSLALGPELAQCCGGRVDWRIEIFDARDVEDLRALASAERDGVGSLTARLGADGRVERRPDRERPGGRLTESLPEAETWTEPLGESARAVYLFGAGHVGRALALALAPLPFVVRWIDSRREAFPARAPGNVALIHALEPAAELAVAPDGALIVVMTHSHALDLDIVAAALSADRFGYVGLIGSATKRARFLRQMRDAGLTEAMLAKLVCPIGVPGIAGKDPAVIAASTAAHLLMAAEGGEPGRSA